MTAEPDATAQSILAAALAEVGERGVRGATTRAIAQRAGVNEVTLFRRFGSKNNLIVEAIIGRISSAVHGSVHYTGDLRGDLERLATTYHAMIGSIGPAFRALVTEVPYDPELREGLSAAQELFEVVAGLLQRYREQGLLRQEPSASSVAAFLGPIVVATVNPLFAESPEQEAFDAEAYVDRYLVGHGAAT